MIRIRRVPNSGVRRQPRDVHSFEEHAPYRGREAADHVEERDLTSAIGADESHRLHRRDADVDVVEGPDSAEVLADPLRVE
jgi:hypothetical protein